MSMYTKMLLVRPDMVKDLSMNTPPAPQVKDLSMNTPPAPQTTNAQKEFYETQMLKEKISPHASLIQTLTRLHNKADGVLKDDTIKGSVKLARYNELMTTSSILMKKIKNYMKWEEVDINPHYPPQNPQDNISDTSYRWSDDSSQWSNSHPADTEDEVEDEGG